MLLHRQIESEKVYGFHGDNLPAVGHNSLSMLFDDAPIVSAFYPNPEEGVRLYVGLIEAKREFAHFQQEMYVRGLDKTVTSGFVQGGGLDEAEVSSRHSTVSILAKVFHKSSYGSELKRALNKAKALNKPLDSVSGVKGPYIDLVHAQKGVIARMPLPDVTDLVRHMTLTFCGVAIPEDERYVQPVARKDMMNALRDAGVDVPDKPAVANKLYEDMGYDRFKHLHSAQRRRLMEQEAAMVAAPDYSSAPRFVT